MLQPPKLLAILENIIYSPFSKPALCKPWSVGNIQPQPAFGWPLSYVWFLHCSSIRKRRRRKRRGKGNRASYSRKCILSAPCRESWLTPGKLSASTPLRRPFCCLECPYLVFTGFCLILLILNTQTKLLSVSLCLRAPQAMTAFTCSASAWGDAHPSAGQQGQVPSCPSWCSGPMPGMSQGTMHATQ